MWWQNLNLLQKIFFCIASPATLLLVIQIIMMLVGFNSGGGDVDADVSLDGDVDVSFDGDFDTDLDADVSAGETLDTDPGLSLFTVRGLIAFFAIGGWVGYTLADAHQTLAIILSVVSGAIALVLMALIMKWLMSLQSSGNLNYSDAIGSVGDVYLTIPPKDQGRGKINVLLNERYVEHPAMQNGDEPIKTGTKIKIVAVVGDCYVVKKYDE